MNSPFADLDARLRLLPGLVILAIGLAMVAGMAVFRVTAGHGVPLVDFFLIPVAAVGWLTRSRWYGYAAAVVAAAVSIAMVLVGPTAAPLGPAAVAGGARLILYLVVLSALGAMRHMQLEHESEARTDPLTGTANGRAFRIAALAEIDRSRRYHHELSLAYLDIDDLKAINDHLGHVEGDQALVQASHAMRRLVRSVDTVARLGGDEFAILMPETRLPEARTLMDRLQEEIAGLMTSAGQQLSCSIGLVTFLRPPASLQQLISAGDDLMYEAKRNGKDRIEQAERCGSDVVA
jgi:diguanylate cyclase (GGDEF)-like protein